MLVLKYAYIVKEDRTPWLLQSDYLYIRFFNHLHVFKDSSLNLYAFISEKITDYLMNSFCHTDFNDNTLLKPFYKYIKEQFIPEQTSKGQLIQLASTWNKSNKIKLPMTWPSQVLNTSKDRDSMSLLGIHLL